MMLQDFTPFMDAGKAVINSEFHVPDLEFCNGSSVYGMDSIVKVYNGWKRAEHPVIFLRVPQLRSPASGRRLNEWTEPNLGRMTCCTHVCLAGLESYMRYFEVSKALAFTRKNACGTSCRNLGICASIGYPDLSKSTFLFLPW